MFNQYIYVCSCFNLAYFSSEGYYRNKTYTAVSDIWTQQQHERAFSCDILISKCNKSRLDRATEEEEKRQLEIVVFFF